MTSQCSNTIEIELKPNTVYITPIDPNLRGEKGADGVGSVFELISGEVFSKYKLVTTKEDGSLILASNLVSDDQYKVLGVSLTESTVVGLMVKVQSGGLIENTSWNFTPRAKLYLGVSGEITDNPVKDGTLTYVGYAITATKIFLEIDGVPEYSSISKRPLPNKENWNPSDRPCSNGQTVFILDKTPLALTVDFTVNQGSLAYGYDFTISGQNITLLPNSGFSISSSDVVQISYNYLSE